MLALASPFSPLMLYLLASNLTGPSLRLDGCIHNANAQQLRKHISLDAIRGWFSVCGSAAQAENLEAQARCIYDANQGCLKMQALCEHAVVL